VMRMRRLVILVILVVVACACSKPPANWAKGGATLDMPRARWTMGDFTVDITPDGRVLVNGYHELNLDQAGRVFDYDNEPIALLEPDGSVIGRDDEPLGVVGTDHAALPDSETAWLSILPSGEVIRYDEDGDRFAFGVWGRSCNVSPRAKQMCMLVTHLVGHDIISRPRSSGVSVGVGVGVGVPIR